MTVIDEVKQKNDIVDVIGQYTKLIKAGRTFRGLCPFHTERRPSFFVYPEQQSWHCFGACNTGGDIFSFIMKKENMAFGEALCFLAEQAGGKASDGYRRIMEIKPDKLHQRVPFFAGSKKMVDKLEEHMARYPQDAKY